MDDYFDDSHARHVRRRYFAFEAPDYIKALGFSDMNTIIATETISSSHYQQADVSAQWRYYITDHDKTTSSLPGYIRGHWKIESMHWLLDVHLGDDKLGRLSSAALSAVR